MLRRTSVEEQLCKPQGKCTWSKFSFGAVTLCLHQRSGEAGHYAKRTLSQIDIKSAAFNPNRRQLYRMLNGLRTTTAPLLTSPNAN